MDVQTASGPALPLAIAIAVGALALALAGALLFSWLRPPRAPARGAEPPPPGTYPDDDLLSFREHPPGFPGARPVPAGGTAQTEAVPVAGHSPVRALTVMALVALLLIGAAAVVAAIAAAADPDPTGAPSTAPSTGTAAPVAPMSVPAAPSSGQPGAGDLAEVALPVGSGGLAARGAFGVVVLERRAVGLTVSDPSLTVALTDGTTALAHLRLPTWNCMTDRPPADPAAAGCRAAVPEYADLPAPALQVDRVGDGMRLHGRFPTYVRPPGGEPVYTGRVYELSVTLRPGRQLPDGWTAAGGELTLGDGHTAALGGGASALRAGG